MLFGILSLVAMLKGVIGRADLVPPDLEGLIVSL